jgi:hypothetical protein
MPSGCFLEYLYNGEIPNSTLLAQYGIVLTKNAHYADCEQLYDECVQYIAGNWREVERMNAKSFATDMTTLLMEDVLGKMKLDQCGEQTTIHGSYLQP